MKTQPDPVHDHALAIVFEGISDPVKRTVFFRANKLAIARESARRDAGTPLPSVPNINAKAEPMRGLFRKLDGRIIRCVPTGGLFGNAIRR